jgi:hypothetical protein
MHGCGLAPWSILLIARRTDAAIVRGNAPRELHEDRAKETAAQAPHRLT